MKVKYLIPVIDFESGEIELTPREELLLKRGDKVESLASIADRLHIRPFQLCESAVDAGYAGIEEVEGE